MAIDKNTPWDGIKGSEIEQYIKDTFNKKAGYFYPNEVENEYLIFADEESKNIYINDSSREDLIIDRIKLISKSANYRAVITGISDVSQAVLYGSTGNELNWNFVIKTLDGIVTPENVICTYRFANGNNVKEETEYYNYGTTVSYNIDKYLSKGENVITISVKGVDTGVVTSAQVIYTAVDLQSTTTFDISKVYNDKIKIPYNINGTGNTTVEVYLDGEKIDTYSSSSYSFNREVESDISNLIEGVHTIQIVTSTSVYSKLFYTDTLYREFVVHRGGSLNAIMIATSIPNGEKILEGRLNTLYGINQYIPYNLKLSAFTSGNSYSKVRVTLNNDTIGEVTIDNGNSVDYTFSTTLKGEAKLSVSNEEVSQTYNINITESNLDISEITNNLEFKFRAIDKNNSFSDRDTISYNNVVGTLKNFNWNNTSGWYNNSLIISKGASLEIDLSSISDKFINKTGGRTFEIEFASHNVDFSDRTPILEYCDDSGSGITITNEKIILREGNTSIETSYKPEENIRVGFVLNSNEMSFIYVDGVVSRAMTTLFGYSFVNKMTFRGSKGAEVILKQINIYSTALSGNDIINNYALYRDNSIEMFDIYNRNNIFTDASKNNIDANKASARLPIMKITGDVEGLEKLTTDKDENGNKIIRIVDIEYTNSQDPTKNFELKNAVLRLQGTSSLQYPKKNFRFYTKENEDTELKVNDSIVKNKLYSFKDKAQPVDLWCLKADYAESSGTHNTGIARLWNDALINTKIDGEYKLRTKAQEAAINDINYPYDVRTTIDGFPILLFRKQTEKDEYIFMGKYNFNNDKGTPSVFGFTDLRNNNGTKIFDASNVECWEVLHNDTLLALFKPENKAEGQTFDALWDKTFECRHPNKNNSTDNLRRLYNWVSTATNEIFDERKEAYLDLYKIAAYYIYLMRFGAVDQVVKNSMLTTEDGYHWFFINYDNDTINGLLNDGQLLVPWDVRRDTLRFKEDEVYYYAGRESRLWNLLENNAEFMEIVRKVDQAMSTTLSFETVIDVFDNQQASKWAEVVYNKDAEYKYIEGKQNLLMLQGSRKHHRKYWLSRRFELFDSIYLSGKYKSNIISFKCYDSTPLDVVNITGKADASMVYGLGINNIPYLTNVMPDTYKNIELQLPDNTGLENLMLGNPVSILGSPHLESLNLSNFSNYLSEVEFNYINGLNGNKLKELIISYEGKNDKGFTIKNLSKLTNLEVLDLSGMNNLTEASLDLSQHYNLKKLYLNNTNVSTVKFANGAMLEEAKFSDDMTSLKIENLPYLDFNRVTLGSNTVELDISNCPKMSNNLTRIKAWKGNFSIVQLTKAVLRMDNVNWDNVDVETLITLKQSLKELDLKGKIRVNSLTKDQALQLEEHFGDIFSPNSALHIESKEEGMLLLGNTTILEGSTETYKVIISPIPEDDGIVEWYLDPNYANCSLDQKGNLTVDESDTTPEKIEIIVNYKVGGVNKYHKELEITIKKRTYPFIVAIEGNSSIGDSDNKYTWDNTYTGNMRAEWVLSSEIAEYVEIESSTLTECNIVKKGHTYDKVSGTLTLKLYKELDGSPILTSSKDISVVMPGVLLTKTTNAPIQEILWTNKIASNENYTLISDVENLTAEAITPPDRSGSIFSGNMSIEHFDEFKEFKNIKEIPLGCFTGCMNLKSIKLPENTTTINSMAFICGIESIEIPDSVIVIDNSAFAFSAQEGIVYAPIKEVYVNSLEHWLNIEFGDAWANPLCYCNADLYINHELITELGIPNGCETIKSCSFAGSSIESVVIPYTVSTIGMNAFSECKKLKQVYIKRPSDFSTLYIDMNAFDDCPELSKVMINNVAQWKHISFNNECANPLHNGASFYDEEGKKITRLSLNDSVSMYSYYGLIIDDVLINVGNDSIRIGNHAFKNSTLGTVTSTDSFKNGITIGSFSFENATITNFNFEHIIDIELSAFRNSHLQNEVELPSIKELSVYALSNTNIQKLIIGPSIKKIGGAALAIPSLYILQIERKEAPELTLDPFRILGDNPIIIGSEATESRLLYVPSGATGYDVKDSYWDRSLLSDARFTLSYIS